MPTIPNKKLMFLIQSVNQCNENKYTLVCYQSDWNSHFQDVKQCHPSIITININGWKPSIKRQCSIKKELKRNVIWEL